MEKSGIDIDETARKLGLYPGDVRRVLWELYSHRQIENNELVRRTCLPKSVLRDLLRELQSILEPPSHHVILSGEGRKALEIIFRGGAEGTLGLDWEFDSDKCASALNVLQRYQELRPSPVRDLDHFAATIHTVVKRAAYMSEAGHLQGQKVMFLGDHDLTSIAVASLDQADLIYVVDIDPRVLDFIAMVARQEQLDIQVVQQDLCDGLPHYLENTFDLVFTDPPYTPNGIRLFVSRAIQALKPDLNKLLYLCYGYSLRSAERALRIQQIITAAGLVLHSVLPGFNRYLGAESIGSCSSLYVCTTTPKTHPLVRGRFVEPLYTGKTDQA